MIYLGIDLGSRTGWAVLDAAGRHVASGTWDCSVRRGEGAGFRYVRFEKMLRELLTAYPGAHLAYEEVQHHVSTGSAHVYGGLQAHLARICEELAVPYVSINVATIKRYGAGKGNADKPAMIAAARARWGHPAGVDDDDEADALFAAACLHAGELGSVKPKRHRKKKEAPMT